MTVGQSSSWQQDSYLGSRVREVDGLYNGGWLLLRGRRTDGVEATRFQIRKRSADSATRFRIRKRSADSATRFLIGKLSVESATGFLIGQLSP